MTQTEKTLQKFGLSSKETTVYLAALQEDVSTPYVLAKKTKIPRTSIYDIITSLSLKGLLTLKTSDGFTKQQTLIKAKNPSVLRSIIRDRHKELTETELDLIHILPQLRDEYHKGDTDSDFDYRAGIDGARATLQQEEAAMTVTNEDILVMTKLLPMDVFGMEELNKDVDHGVEASGQRKKIIPLNEWSKHVLTYQYGRNSDYITKNSFRYIEEPAFEINLRITIIGEYVYKTCAEKEEVWGMIIKSKAYSSTLASIFYSMWPHAKPVTEEFVQSLGENELLKKETRRDKITLQPF